MDLHQYYKENKDEINSSIMEIASELASAGLVEKHGKPFDEFVEPEHPDDPDSGTCYKEEYRPNSMNSTTRSTNGWPR